MTHLGDEKLSEHLCFRLKSSYCERYCCFSLMLKQQMDHNTVSYYSIVNCMPFINPPAISWTMDHYITIHNLLIRLFICSIYCRPVVLVVVTQGYASFLSCKLINGICVSGVTINRLVNQQKMYLQLVWHSVNCFSLFSSKTLKHSLVPSSQMGGFDALRISL